MGEEIGAVAGGVSAVREAARALIGFAHGGSEGPKAAGGTGRNHVASTLLSSGDGLVSLSGPWVDEAAVVEAVDDKARGVTKDHVAGVESDDAVRM